MYVKQVSPFKWGDFGPIHDCPTCGNPIQYVHRRGHNICEDLATGGRHFCEYTIKKPVPVAKPVAPKPTPRPVPVKVGNLDEGFDL